MNRFTSHIGFLSVRKRIRIISTGSNPFRIMLKKIFLIHLLPFVFAFFSGSEIPLDSKNNTPDKLPFSLISFEQETEKDSPYMGDFQDRLKLYSNVFQNYESGKATKRDVLYQRIRLVWLHQRLTPSEQLSSPVPDLEKNFLNGIELTEPEKEYHQKLNDYLALKASYDELPLEKEDELYQTYGTLHSVYENLPLSSRVFLVDNLPNDPNLERMAKELSLKLGKEMRHPFTFELSNQKPGLWIHFINSYGNAVALPIGELSEAQKHYLKTNTRKSFVTQVYPLPVEQNPTTEDFEKWQDTYLYKITLDGEQIDNDSLAEIDPTSIHHVKLSEVRWNGNRRVPYDFVVQLYTYEAFEEMVEKYRPSKGIIPMYLAKLQD